MGDQFRLPDVASDDGEYFRSLAAVFGHGAVADHLPMRANLLGKLGFDIVIIETVGSEQADVAIAELADVVVLLLQPETGDDLQWQKAGVLEIARIIAIQKADLPGAEHVVAQVRTTLALSTQPLVLVILTIARTHLSLAELTDAAESFMPREATLFDKRPDAWRHTFPSIGQDLSHPASVHCISISQVTPTAWS